MLGNDTKDFRIVATGVTLDIDQNVNIVKKLKLTGIPIKIHKNTAFIKGILHQIYICSSLVCLRFRASFSTKSISY